MQTKLNMNRRKRNAAEGFEAVKSRCRYQLPWTSLAPNPYVPWRPEWVGTFYDKLTAIALLQQPKILDSY